MRKAIAIALMFAASLSSAGARAGTQASGTVLLPADTPYQEIIVAHEYGDNGTFGYIVPVEASAAGKTFTLTRTSGVTGREHLAVEFFAELTSGTDNGCVHQISDDGTSETGTICVNSGTPAWAIVYMISDGTGDVGANATFTLSY